MLFPHVAKELAKARWATKTHRPWPYDPPGWRPIYPPFTIQEIAEADALVDAAMFSSSVDSAWHEQTLAAAIATKQRPGVDIIQLRPSSASCTSSQVDVPAPEQS